MDSNFNCPLCQKNDTLFFARSRGKRGRDYFRCRVCDLIFCHPEHLLSAEQEKDRYHNHQNDVRTEGYISFLRKLLDPMLDLAPATSSGLDFGCGPYPMMSELAAERGVQLAAYDLYFYPEQELLDHKYQMITCSEVVEHFYSPQQGFEQMVQLLRPGGLLGIMTSIYSDEINFSDWWYIQDPTHVSIYTQKTLQWIATRWNLQLIYQKENCLVFRAS